MWGFPKIGGKPPKWMVKIMGKPYDKWMIWGENPPFSETAMCVYVGCVVGDTLVHSG